MGIAEEAAKLRENVPEQYRPSGQSYAALLQEQTAADTADAIRQDSANTAQFIDNDIERIIIDGAEAVSEGPLSEAERRNLESRLSAEAQDDARLAELAGIRAGRLEVTGLGSRERQAAQARIKANQESSARMQAMLALQAALDNARAEYKAADQDVQNILDRHTTPEEKAHLDSIEDDDVRAQEELRIMREKLERGKLSQAEFDDFKKRWDVRAEKRQAVVDAQADLKAGMKGEDPEQDRKVANNTVKNVGAGAVEAAAEQLEEPQRKIADTATETSLDSGNASLTNVETQEHVNLEDDFFATAPGDVSETFNLAASGQEEAPQQQIVHDQPFAALPSGPTGMG